MVISSRLKTIGDFIDSGDVVFDVGADHGLLEQYLLSKYENILVIAVENKIGPYKILEKNLTGLKNVKLSLSDGISELVDNVNTVVLAGMGGLNIEKILKAHPYKLNRVKKIVIDAHRDIDIARKTIIELGFKINKEKIVYEQEKFYIVTEFIRTGRCEISSSDDIEIGHKLYIDELWPKYKDHLINENLRTIEKIKDAKNAQDKILNLKKMNERLEKYGKN